MALQNVVFPTQERNPLQHSCMALQIVVLASHREMQSLQNSFMGLQNVVSRVTLKFACFY